MKTAGFKVPDEWIKEPSGIPIYPKRKKRFWIHFYIGSWEFSIGKLRIDKRFSICFGPRWNGAIGLLDKDKKRYSFDI